MSRGEASPRVKASRSEIVSTYDGFAPFYAAATVWEESTRDTVLSRAGIGEGDRVLDCGCGPGTLVLESARRVGPRGVVHGADLSAKMLEETERRAREAGLWDRIRLHRVDLHDRLPFEDGSFDAVISTYVLDLIDNPEIPRVLAEKVRVLRPGGRLVLGGWTFGEGADRASSDLYVAVYERIRVAFACRPQHLQPQLEKAGLANLRREYIAHTLSAGEAGLLFGPLAAELESHPDLKERVAALDGFVFSSEVLSGTKP